ncbi:MAG: ABC-type transport auxiliary lipoprotein family protein [Burkholderiales bacterium]
MKIKKNPEPGILQAVLLAICCCLAGCTTYKGGAPQTIFDLGPLPAAQRIAGLKPISVANPGTPAWLDNREMYYRLSYADDRQLRQYGNSRWSMPPIQLFEQRLKARIAQAGGTVLSASEGAGNVPLNLHLEAEDFTQTFDSPAHSSGQITLRASVFNGRSLVAQKTFSGHADAPTLDASGGARSLSDASDAVITDILQWLAEPMPQK